MNYKLNIILFILIISLSSCSDISLKNEFNNCGKLNNQAYSDACYMQLDLTLEFCHSLPSYKTNSQWSESKEECFYILAQIRNDVAICDLVESTYYKDICYAKVIPISGSIKDCEKISIEQRNITAPYYSCLAGVTKEVTLCSKIEFPNNDESTSIARENCVNNLAVTSNNKELCTGNCIYELAFKNNDYTLCSQITGKYNEMCYHRLAIYNQDKNICNRIKSDTERNSCLADLK